MTSQAPETVDPEPTPVAPPAPNVREIVGRLVDGRQMRLLGLSATALASALLEAIVLVAITQIAFALANGSDTVKSELGPITIHSGVGVTIIVSLVVVVLRGLTQVANGWQSTNLVVSFSAEKRKEFARAFVHSSLAEQTRNRGGELQELLTSYVARAAGVMDTLSKGVTSICSLVALIGTGVLVSPVAALGLGVAVVLLGVTLRPLRNMLRVASRRAANADMAFAMAVSEFAGLGREMQVFGVEDNVSDRLDRLVDENAIAGRKVNFTAFLFTPMYATALLFILVAGMAVIQALELKNLASLGAVMLVMIRSLAYAQLAQGVYAALHANAPYLSDFDARLQSLRDDAVDRNGSEMSGMSSLVVADVDFEYTPGVPALTDISFELSTGEVIGIVGPSGSGKSTLVQLMLRLRTPTAGTITADGEDITTISLDSWRRATAFVPQESRLIHGSVAENISFYRDGYSQADLEDAARLAHIHDDIEAWGGYDYQVGDAGHALSGGQRQRICIARALLSKPSLLVLDEPTSALDVHSEAKVRDALDGLRGTTTVVVIAHRLSTLDSCDRIMVVKDGRLVGFDTPDRLRETDQFYRDALAISGLH